MQLKFNRFAAAFYLSFIWVFWNSLVALADKSRGSARFLSRSRLLISESHFRLQTNWEMEALVRRWIGEFILKIAQWPEEID